MQIHACSPEQEEPKDENEDGLHVAENLERNSCESTNADELTEVGPDSNYAWQ